MSIYGMTFLMNFREDKIVQFFTLLTLLLKSGKNRRSGIYSMNSKKKWKCWLMRIGKCPCRHSIISSLTARRNTQEYKTICSCWPLDTRWSKCWWYMVPRTLNTSGMSYSMVWEDVQEKHTVSWASLLQQIQNFFRMVEILPIPGFFSMLKCCAKSKEMISFMNSLRNERVIQMCDFWNMVFRTSRHSCSVRRIINQAEQSDKILDLVFAR